MDQTSEFREIPEWNGRIQTSEALREGRARFACLLALFDCSHGTPVLVWPCAGVQGLRGSGRQAADPRSVGGSEPEGELARSREGAQAAAPIVESRRGGAWRLLAAPVVESRAERWHGDARRREALVRRALRRKSPSRGRNEEALVILFLGLMFMGQ